VVTFNLPKLEFFSVPWLVSGSTNPCSFCGDPTGAQPDKHGWHVCPDKYCQAASSAQAERMYAGLFDTPETRLSALNWTKSRG